MLIYITRRIPASRRIRLTVPKTASFIFIFYKIEYSMDPIALLQGDISVKMRKVIPARWPE